MTGDPRRLGLTTREIDQRARAFVPALRNWWAQWLQFVGRDLLRPGQAASLQATQDALQKVDTNARRLALREALRALLRRYGGVSAAAAVTQELGKPSRLARTVTQSLRWRDFEDEIATAVERSAVEHLNQAARRVIRSGGIVSASTVIMEANQDRLFSSARGLARNVLATADAVGKEAVYDELEIEFVQWLAFQNPIWDRRHDLLNGEIRRRGERFKMPISGALLLHPHDPQGPIGEVINCRCTLAPVIKGSAAWRRAQAEAA